MGTRDVHRSMMLILGLLLVIVLASNNAVQAQTSNAAFTYQGSLSDGGNPANGPYDFQFRLYTDIAQGSQVGIVVSQEDVPVTLGLFTVSLDFGAIFDGTPRFLELAVRPGNSTGEYAILSPRQALTAAPMSVFSANSNSTNALQNHSVSSAAPFNDQVLKWNGTQWVPAADDTLFLAGNGTSPFAARSDHNHFGQNWTGDVPFTGLWVENHSSVPGSSGIYGRSENTVGVDGNSNSGYGIQGVSQTSIGVAGFTHDSNGVGVYGRNFNNGDAGRFTGNVAISGNLTKGGGSFKIDHPLDPANKYLYHSFVESPDMMNIYNGNIVLGTDGTVVVTLPAYFEALNMDFRYQLTAIGAPGPNLYIAEEIADNHFKIAGGTLGMKVSWQVTGIRHDPYAEAHRIPIEQDKPPQEHGKYLYPKEYGQPITSGIDYAPQPNLTSALPQQPAQPAR